MWKESFLISVLILPGCVGETTKDNPVIEPKESVGEKIEINTSVINMDKDKEVKSKVTNLFKEPVIMDFNEGFVRMKLDKAELVDEYKTSNFDGTSILGYNKASASQVIFHISGDIYNDSLKVFSFGNSLGDVQFKLIYDGKHVFEVLGSTENSEGTKTESATVYSLERKRIHLSVDVPKSILEDVNNSKNILLRISANGKDIEIELR